MARSPLSSALWGTNVRKLLTITSIILSTFILKTLLFSSGPPPPFPSSFTPGPSAQRCKEASQYDSTKTSPTSGNHVEDFLPLEKAESLCKANGLEIYKDRSKPRKVYDLFLFNTEFDWLEIRVNELFPHVDHFVLLEAMQTFSANPKPLHYNENKQCLHDLAPQKLIYHTLDLAARSYGWWYPNWRREEYARNAMFTEVFPLLSGAEAPNSKDVIIVSDIDEIPRPETITILRNCDFPKRTNLRSRFYYYSYQWEHLSKDWEHPQATWFDGFQNTILPNKLRWEHKKADWNYENSSWHCSSCFSTIAEMDYKIASFSHQEFNKDKFRAASEIVRRVRNGLDLFDRPKERYVKQTPVTDFPKYLQEGDNEERFGFLLNRDPENANFEDYHPSHNIHP